VDDTYIHTYHSRFIPEGVAEVSQIFLGGWYWWVITNAYAAGNVPSEAITHYARDWWVITTANATCFLKHGEGDNTFLVTHSMTDLCERCLTLRSHADRLVILYCTCDVRKPICHSGGNTHLLHKRSRVQFPHSANICVH
jgi:hypothetical protein